MRVDPMTGAAVRVAAPERSEDARHRAGPEAGATALLDEPRFRGDRSADARARHRREHRDLHAARPGHAALASRRAARQAGRAPRPRSRRRVADEPDRHRQAAVAADARRAARRDGRLRGRLRPLPDAALPHGRHGDRARGRRHGHRHVLRGARPARGPRPAVHGGRRPHAVGSPRRRARPLLLRTPLRRRSERRRPCREREQPPDDGGRHRPPRLQRSRGRLRDRRLRAGRHAARSPAHLGQPSRRLALALPRVHGAAAGRGVARAGASGGERRLRAPAGRGPGAHRVGAGAA